MGTQVFMLNGFKKKVTYAEECEASNSPIQSPTICVRAARAANESVVQMYLMALLRWRRFREPALCHCNGRLELHPQAFRGELLQA